MNRDGVIIHIYIEISQGNSLCSYLYHKQAKMSFFLFLLQNQRIERRNRSCGVCGGVKLHVFSDMWNKDLIQIQQSYEKQEGSGEEAE
jgi:hypothetical protein